MCENGEILHVLLHNIRHLHAHRNARYLLNSLTTSVQALLQHGSVLGAVDADGRTPLHYAAREGMVQNVVALLEKGSAANQQDAQGVTPLHLALETRAPIAIVIPTPATRVILTVFKAGKCARHSI